MNDAFVFVPLCLNHVFVLSSFVPSLMIFSASHFRVYECVCERMDLNSCMWKRERGIEFREAWVLWIPIDFAVRHTYTQPKSYTRTHTRVSYVGPFRIFRKTNWKLNCDLFWKIAKHFHVPLFILQFFRYDISRRMNEKKRNNLFHYTLRFF